MQAEELIKQALALSDEEISRWLPKSDDQPMLQVVQDLGPLTDRRLRAYIACFHKLNHRFVSDQYSSVDPTCLTLEAYKDMAELTSSMDLLNELMSYQCTQLYWSKIEARYRGGRYALVIGPKEHMLRVRKPGADAHPLSQIAAIFIRGDEEADGPPSTETAAPSKLH